MDVDEWIKKNHPIFFVKFCVIQECWRKRIYSSDADNEAPSKIHFRLELVQKKKLFNNFQFLFLFLIWISLKKKNSIIIQTGNMTSGIGQKEFGIDHTPIKHEFSR